MVRLERAMGFFLKVTNIFFSAALLFQRISWERGVFSETKKVTVDPGLKFVLFGSGVQLPHPLRPSLVNNLSFKIEGVALAA